MLTNASTDIPACTPTERWRRFFYFLLSADAQWLGLVSASTLSNVYQPSAAGFSYQLDEADMSEHDVTRAAKPSAAQVADRRRVLMMWDRVILVVTMK